ncbi:leucyl/phenylalanyl-tRNA--protein transferase [Nocardioides panacisoli]|uniref:Leucyl/phenylalanyl-tRNA--protein transferase n=1 Tax=Nocardioides panacisoli TaxID=627624 RepID=A0ABP7IIE9_9ACTN
MNPIEPPPTPWQLPTREQLAALGDDQGDDLVALGADLAPGTLLAAYRTGLFPMPHGRRKGDFRAPRVGWWCPRQRGVLPLDGLHVSRSLRRSLRDFDVRVDTAFAEVVDGCADPGREGGWIDGRIKEAYADLHRLGWAHSIETWREGRLVGGLYGVSVGGLFAGESMFHRERDASKVALVRLVELLRDDADPDTRLIDVQWSTPHLASLGVVEMPRSAYLARLQTLVDGPAPRAFTGEPTDDWGG